MKNECNWFKHRGYKVYKEQSNNESVWIIEGIDKKFYMSILAIEYINEVIYGE